MDIHEFEAFRVDDRNIDSSSDSLSDSSSDESVIHLDVQLFLILATTIKTYLTMIESFEPIELSSENQSFVIHNLQVNDLLYKAL